MYKKSFMIALITLMALALISCAKTEDFRNEESKQSTVVEDDEEVMATDKMQKTSFVDLTENKIVESEQIENEETNHTISLDELDRESVTKLSVWARGEKIFTENKKIINDFFEVIIEREIIANYEPLEGDIIFIMHIGENEEMILYQNNVIRTASADYKLKDNVHREIILIYNAICNENDVEGYVVPE